MGPVVKVGARVRVGVAAHAHEAVEDEGGDEAAGHSHPQQPRHETNGCHEHIHDHHHLEQVGVGEGHLARVRVEGWVLRVGGSGVGGCRV